MSKENDCYAFHAVVLAYGATREELAASLEAKAAEIRAGCSNSVSRGDAGVMLVRQHDDSGGEETMHQRMHMVFATEGDGAEPAIAMFRDKGLAERFATGKPLFDEGDGLGVDIGIARVDLVGTWWNSVDPDPTEAP